MKEQKLTFEQAIPAAKIFLNTFGLILEDTDELTVDSRLKIYDKDYNVVGEVSFSDNLISISAEFNGLTLDANYEIPKIFSFIDKEGPQDEFYGQWNSNIFFILTSDNSKFNGEFNLESSIDTEFGKRCVCHPIIRCEIPNIGQITLEMLRQGKTFGINVKRGEYNEKIEIRPFDDLNGYILHDLKNGEYDKQKHSFPYRLYAGIFTAGRTEEYQNKLHIYYSETEYDESLNYKNGYIDKVNKDTTRESVIQKGKLMQEIDKDMYKKIQIIRNIFSFQDLSLLDNLISVCYDSYSTEEIKSLLGIEKQELVYQDGSNKLKDAFFSKKKTYIEKGQNKRYTI